jgi:hypothetical protein
MKLQELKNWIADSEASTTISLYDAKGLWENKKMQLQSTTK